MTPISTIPEAAHQADFFLAAALRGESYPLLSQPGLIPERALYHGVSALLATHAKTMSALPSDVQTSIRRQALAETMWDLRHRAILIRLLDALSCAGIRTVILKGTALAYGRYPAPSLRPRGDTDLLVPRGDAETIHQILKAQGFLRNLDTSLDIATSALRQEAWSHQSEDGSDHVIDLHWGVMNAWSLAALFDTDEVFTASQPLPTLAPSARMMGNLHAVYHSCLHRAVHIQSPYRVGDDSFYGGDRLIWLHDLHLMLPHLSNQDRTDLIRECRTHKTADLCLDALIEAQNRLGTEVSAELLSELSALANPGANKTARLPSTYLSRRAGWPRIWDDLVEIPDWKTRLLFLRKLLFPSHAYMRAKFPDKTESPIALLYLRRFVGALKRRRSEKSR